MGVVEVEEGKHTKNVNAFPDLPKPAEDIQEQHANGNVPEKEFSVEELFAAMEENTVIQTCVVACYGLAFSGGFGTYLIGLDSKTYNIINNRNNDTHDSTEDIKDPHLSWIIGFMFSVSFLGLLAVVPLRKIMIIDYKLTYPSGTATAVLINSFHTPHGYEEAMKQVLYMGKYFFFSFFFSMFKWFFSGLNNACGFDSFPTLGLKAYQYKFYFDFSMTYVGAGMICPHLINVSLLLGGILSWGLMWPLLEKKAGDWYPADAVEGSKLEGLYGYKVLVAIAIILGDGLYNFVKISAITLWSLYKTHSKKLPVKADDAALEEINHDEQRRTAMFMKDRIPLKVAAVCYVVLAIVSTISVPHIFPQVKWYHVFISYIMAPVLGFCNAYGCGLTDWNLASTYGKLGLFVFSAWAGANGGVLVGLVSCGVMMVIVSCSADLMQDFKTGYLTLSSPRSMFVSQEDGDNRMNFIRDKPLKKWAGYIPIPMAMAFPFYIGPYFTIDMFVGTVIVYVWQKLNLKKAKLLVPAVASGLICGDGIWTLISAILALAKKAAPLCMTFLPSKTADHMGLPAY
ncbi:hypothetical protein GOP47_0017509 [Adiantum capillus-veneris]|uniref:Uncharacterized protein n=1 Tax=Adiantum capillus-veneris TaxID=13818 RepID=A0A9D4UFG8_ADICA|nr:hypothetical protein GOP47_0017509 [Adiantum capillus-veneris]